jgi:hypothetical protein
MRTTLDLPDTLYRKTKAVAALRGSSMKDLIIRAIEQDVNSPTTKKQVPRNKLPVIKRPSATKLDCSDFDFDDLLG